MPSTPATTWAAPSPASARARLSCTRCQKRKKRCDRVLPSCRNCVTACVQCSFAGDDLTTASYSVSYIQTLEAEVRRLSAAEDARRRDDTAVTEAQASELAAADNPARASQDHHRREDSAIEATADPDIAHGYGDINMLGAAASGQEGGLQRNHGRRVSENFDYVSTSEATAPTMQASHPFIPEPALVFGQQLSSLSLEATAERHLGATSGLSFASLTQTVLRRLWPDKADLTFTNDTGNPSATNIVDFNSPSDALNNSFFESLSQSVSVHPLLFEDFFLSDLTGPTTAVNSFTWPSESHVRWLVDIYFAHSHTLYPILKRSQVVNTLDRLCRDPHDLASHAPLDLFRIYMVLAIGSTAHSTVTLTDESESIMFYQRALQFSEQALACDEMSALETLILQVSYSFFNQLGPNTWFLVGVAARLALGMGLHEASTYPNYPPDKQQRCKRLFFSIFMMDRIVSITLGRPFALHDEDIDATPFEDTEDDFIHPDRVNLSSSFEPSPMAVPLHILSLRTIAGKIARQVYGKRRAASTPEECEKTLASLHKELLDWRRTIPFPLPDAEVGVPHLQTAWYDFNYYTHLAMLYRPSPLCPFSDFKQAKLLEEAASKSLRFAFSMHQQQQFAYNWLNFLALFTATLSLVFAVMIQPGELSTVLATGRIINDLEMGVQLFEAFGSKFLGAQKVRNMVSEICQRYKRALQGQDAQIFHGVSCRDPQ